MSNFYELALMLEGQGPMPGAVAPAGTPATAGSPTTPPQMPTTQPGPVGNAAAPAPQEEEDELANEPNVELKQAKAYTAGLAKRLGLPQAYFVKMCNIIYRGKQMPQFLQLLQGGGTMTPQKYNAATAAAERRTGTIPTAAA